MRILNYVQLTIKLLITTKLQKTTKLQSASVRMQMYSIKVNINSIIGGLFYH